MSESCPDVTKLRHLIAGGLAEDDELPLESHLEHCEACQQQLEQLVDLKPTECLAGITLDESPSGSLREVIQRLKAGDLKASHVDPQTSTLIVRDVLEESDRPGVLGRLGNYDVLEFVGQGGMGAVVKARDRTLDRDVAIKIMLPELAARSVARERFVREAKSAASIHHPHVVTVYAVDDSADVPYLVMEYVLGETLTDRIRRCQRLPVDDVVQLALELSEGLDAAHRRGLVHRDIKPANVLIDEETGVAKISDFGLVKAMDDDSGLTATGTIAGTPEFMSPEQAVGSTKLDARSDLFSSGTVLYSALTGVSPFQASSAVATLRRVCDEEPTPLTEVCPDLPHWFTAIVHRLMSKSPADRFPTARDVVTAIRQGQDAAAQRELSGSSGRSRIVAATIGLLLLIVMFAWAFRTDIFKPSVPQDGLVIEGRETPFESLETVIASASPGDSILVYGDREYVTEGVNLDHEVTLRAAPGAMPTIVTTQTRPAIRTSAPLRLEGLKFKRSLDSTGPAGLDRALIAVEDSELKMANCQFEVPGRSTGVGVYGSATIRNCRFSSPDGAGILLIPSTNGVVAVRNCLFAGRVGVFVSADVDDATDAELELRQNTFLTESALQIVRSELAQKTLEVSARENRFQVTSHVFGHAGLRRMRLTNRTLDGFRDRFQWKVDEGNTFSESCRFLVLQRSGAGDEVFSVDDQAAWRKFWRLDGEASSGTGPAGVDESILGPGTAFQRFQQLPDYADWAR